MGALTTKTGQLDGTNAQARTSWQNFRGSVTHGTLTDSLLSMATGTNRCFYCEDSAGSTIDHFDPAPMSTYVWTNLILSCLDCNSRYKRDQYPLDAAGQPLLLNPTSEDPLEHFDYSPQTGQWVPLTVRGEETRDVLMINRETLQERRRTEWASLAQRLTELGRRAPATTAAAVAAASADLCLGRERSLSAILLWLLRSGPDLDKPTLEERLGVEAVDALLKYRDALLELDP